MSDEEKTGVEGTVAEPEPVAAETAAEEVPAADPADNEAEPAPPAEDAAEKKEVPTMEGVTWVAASDGNLPDGALKGGDDNGNDLYVARAEHEGATIPGKLLADHGVCYVPWGCEEHGKPNYEVLVIPEDQVSWVATSGETIPPNSIIGGLSVEGETLYVGRAPHEGTLSIGKVHPSHGVLYISYGGGEHSYSEYEILVKND